MSDYSKVLIELKKELIQFLDYLEYSYSKVLASNIDVATKDAEALETLEALVSRFSRTSDIFTAKYLRAFVLHGDPGFVLI